MGRKTMYYSCDLKHDCLNCTHPECIEGEPIKNIDVNKTVNSIINKKYYSSEKYKQANIERCRDYKRRNKEKVYAKNQEWVENHKEHSNRVRRKWIRLKYLKEGYYKIAGSARIDGIETIIYKGRGKNPYFYFQGEKYGEISENDLVWLWIQKVEVV